MSPLTSTFLLPLDWDLFKVPPSWEPQVLPPASQPPSVAYPFNIPPTVYKEALDVKWPISIALVYATSVTLLNHVNKARGNKPWAISRTGAFTAFVLAHNIFLTLYSGWTFVGMLRCLFAVFGGLLENGRAEKYGIVPVVDALCKMSGPRGLGNAAAWDPYAEQWSVKNTAVRLLAGSPDPNDVGRFWNEGLAFYGWIFYLSKFYEVLDTAIILAKGKRSSLLQTYHHAGAMMCMWAGIRFMSPPIWLFVQLNSGIHTLMYFYYTVVALGVKVPSVIKRSLTSMQIMQFLVGVSFAISHLFVGYTLPVNTPYIFSHAVGSAVSSVSSALPTVTSVTAAGLASWLKKGALRAAGFEGLAENVKDSSGQRFGIDALKAQIAEDSRSEIRWRMEYPVVHCIDTSGQTFAIWLNCVYLAPLTYLFGRFFYISYIKRAAAATKEKKGVEALSQRMARSSSDAAKGVDREIRQALGDAQGYNSPIDDEFAIELQGELDGFKQAVVDAAESVKIETQNIINTVTGTVETVIVSTTTDDTATTTTTTTETTGIKSEENGELNSAPQDTQANAKFEQAQYSSEQQESTENHEHDAHTKAGESYADAVKIELNEALKEEPSEEKLEISEEGNTTLEDHLETTEEQLESLEDHLETSNEHSELLDEHLEPSVELVERPEEQLENEAEPPQPTSENASEASSSALFG